MASTRVQSPQPTIPTADIHVAKLGGSLLDLPDLPGRLNQWLALHADQARLLIVGGSETADVVRRWDAMHHVGEAAGHWLAIRAMQFNAHLIASVLENVRWADGPDTCRAAWAEGCIALVEPLAWLEREHAQGIEIPHRWSYTSDSIAAHLARQMDAACLTLLKSTASEPGCTRQDLADRGLVDGDFPAASAGIPRIQLVNLRQDWRTCVEVKSSV